MSKPIVVILSCEHAVNTVPADYKHLFKQNHDVLETHRAIDIGAANMFDHLALTLKCTSAKAGITRLLIDCNRSLKHPHCFSEWTASLPKKEKETLIATYYQPFREDVIQAIRRHIAQGQRVLHLSIHSFTPILNDIIRQTDVGFLYDPKRSGERTFAYRWKHELSKISPQYRVRMNYPYRGISDGFTSFLRQQFSEQTYLGIEVESNQALMTSSASQEALIKAMTTTLLNTLARDK